MIRRSIILFVTSTVIICSPSLNAQSNHPRDGSLGFIVTGLLGDFTITFPTANVLGEEVGFNTIYGSKSGVSFGGEVSIGSARHGIFGVGRYRHWEKSGSPKLIGAVTFSGELLWVQDFLSGGIRYVHLSNLSRTNRIAPFFGAGAMYSTASESIAGRFDNSQRVNETVSTDGLGFYLEGGSYYYFSSSVAIGASLEYSSLKLGITDEDGERQTVDGGGGLYIGLSLSLMLGKSLALN